MRPRLLALLLPPALAWGPAACAPTHRGVCEAQVRATCELAFRCCTPEEAAFVVLGPAATYATSAGECMDRLVPACRAEDARDDAVELGRLELDAARADACLAALGAARDACDLGAFRDALSAAEGAEGPCARVSVGVVADGAACEDDAECGPGGSCQVRDGASGGICARAGSAGDGCAGGRPCEEGLACLRGACGAPPAEGEPCPDFVCADGNLCAATGVCERLPSAGEACAFGCSDGLFCAPADGGGEGVCRAQKAPGAPCDGAFGECGAEQCVSGRCTGDELEGVCAGP